jgi:branched-chain amino acid transport system substrate-binding protein
MKLLNVAIAIFMVLLLSGCSGQITGGLAQEEPVKIGVISAQTGPVSALSLASKYAIEMAAEDWNSNHDNKFEVVYEDNQGKAQATALAFAKLVDSDKVAAIIVDTTTATMTAGPIAGQEKVPVIAYIATSPVVTTAGDYVFRTSPVNIAGMKLMAQHMKELGITEVSIICEMNDYPISIKDGFKKDFAELGGKILAEELVSDIADARTEIAKANSKKPQALVVFVNAPLAGATILKQIEELGIDLPVFGNECTGSTQALRIAGKEALEGLTVVAPTYDTERMSEFQSRFTARFGDEVVFDWLYVADAYDAAMLEFEAISQVGTDGEALKEFLYNVKDYKGLSGDITFDENGDPVGAEYILVQFQDGKKVAIN